MRAGWRERGVKSPPSPRHNPSKGLLEAALTDSGAFRANCFPFWLASRFPANQDSPGRRIPPLSGRLGQVFHFSRNVLGEPFFQMGSLSFPFLCHCRRILRRPPIRRTFPCRPRGSGARFRWAGRCLLRTFVSRKKWSKNGSIFRNTERLPAKKTKGPPWGPSMGGAGVNFLQR